MKKLDKKGVTPPSLIKKVGGVTPFLMLVLLLITTFSGCALLAIPAKVIEGTFGIIGKVFDLVGKLPKPPPGVFYN